MFSTNPEDTNNYQYEGVQIEGFRHNGLVCMETGQDYADLEDVLGYFPHLEPYLEAEVEIENETGVVPFISVEAVQNQIAKHGLWDDEGDEE